MDENDYDTIFTDGPVCPHCGHEHEDGSEYHESEDTTRICCSECGQEFESERSISISYTTSKIDHAAEREQERRRVEEKEAQRIACQQFPPGQLVRIIRAPAYAPHLLGRSGVVANRELSRLHPSVIVVVEGDPRSPFCLPPAFVEKTR